MTTAEETALAGERVRIGLFFRIELESVTVGYWMGIGAIEPGVNALDPSGATYYGLGQMVNFPEFQRLINGTADRIDLILSGVSGKLLSESANGVAAVRNRPCAFGFALLESDWQMLGPVRWIRRCVSDVVTFEQAPEASTDAQIKRTMRLSVGSLMTGRRRRGLSYFTDEDQQRRSPGDLFCERTKAMSQSVNKPWPRY